MSVNTETQSVQGKTTVLKDAPAGGVYASLFEKINLNPVSRLGDIIEYQDDSIMADASADERVTAAIQVFMQVISKSGQKVEKLDKSLLDQHIAELDHQISRQLDEVMHHPEFQRVESLWRGLKHTVDRTDFRQNVKIEILDVSKDDLRQDFEDAPEIIQTGLYHHTYSMEYDQPGGEPIAAVISSYEFDSSAQDVALLRNISKVSAAAHMPFIGSVGPKFFHKNSMEEVAAIKDIGNYFDRAEYIKWKAFRESEDSRYIGLTMPRVLGRLPYGPDTVPVRSFNYVEEVKGPDHEKYLWTNASFAFAANMVKSFIDEGQVAWRKAPLQARFFGSLQAGEALWDLIAEVLCQPAPNMAVLTCYHRVIALGFQGLFSLNAVSQTQRDEVVKALSERVAPPDANLSLVVHRLGKHRWSLMRSVWFWIALAVITTGVLWWGGHLWLQSLLSAQILELHG